MDDKILDFKQSLFNLSVGQLHIMREELTQKILNMVFDPENVQKIIAIDEVLALKGDKQDE